MPGFIVRVLEHTIQTCWHTIMRLLDDILIMRSSFALTKPHKRRRCITRAAKLIPSLRNKPNNQTSKHSTFFFLSWKKGYEKISFKPLKYWMGLILLKMKIYLKCWMNPRLETMKWIFKAEDAARTCAVLCCTLVQEPARQALCKYNFQVYISCSSRRSCLSLQDLRA